MIHAIRNAGHAEGVENGTLKLEAPGGQPMFDWAMVLKRA